MEGGAGRVEGNAERQRQIDDPPVEPQPLLETAQRRRDRGIAARGAEGDHHRFAHRAERGEIAAADAQPDQHRVEPDQHDGARIDEDDQLGHGEQDVDADGRHLAVSQAEQAERQDIHQPFDDLDESVVEGFEQRRGALGFLPRDGAERHAEQHREHQDGDLVAGGQCAENVLGEHPDDQVREGAPGVLGIDGGPRCFGGEDHLADDLAGGELQFAAGLPPVAQRHAERPGDGEARDDQQHQAGEVAVGGAIEKQPAEAGGNRGEQQGDDAHLQQADVDFTQGADSRQLALVEPTEDAAGDQPGKHRHGMQQQAPEAALQYLNHRSAPCPWSRGTR